MNTLPNELSKTHWEDRHRHDLEALAAATGKTPAEIEADLSRPDQHATTEDPAPARCDHGGPNEGHTRLPVFPGDVWLCHCGALVDYDDRSNWGETVTAMTAEAITAAIEGAIVPARGESE